ncbi:MAG: VOC family protein [Candidatus Micrarchaeia archaeon]|jgi:catechol 2,3-dioxygenase-like lactoylglutathione lyase family enzyme
MAGISVMLGVKDMRKSVEFYENMLGFSAKLVMPNKEFPKYANFSRFGAVFMLQPLGNMRDGLIENFRFAKETEPGVGAVHYVEFPQYEDMDAYYAELKGRGVAIVKDITDRSWGAKDFMVADPDGHLISFTRPDADGARCFSCGMPIPHPQDHAIGNPGIPYCVHCTDEKGSLKPFELVLGGSKKLLISQGTPETEAEAKAREYLIRMPAWKEH